MKSLQGLELLKTFFCAFAELGDSHSQHEFQNEILSHLISTAYLLKIFSPDCVLGTCEKDVSKNGVECAKSVSETTKMPSRLIQGLDNFDTCSQFSDSATLHTLTRMGALQKEVYFSRSESNFHNFDTISYGNSSTCCCDAEIKVISTLFWPLKSILYSAEIGWEWNLGKFISY